jgi:hypothetical protein
VSLIALGPIYLLKYEWKALEGGGEVEGTILSSCSWLSDIYAAGVGDRGIHGFLV